MCTEIDFLFLAVLIFPSKLSLGNRDEGPMKCGFLSVHALNWDFLCVFALSQSQVFFSLWNAMI